MEAPTQVRRAVLLLWAALLLGVVEALFNLAPLGLDDRWFSAVMFAIFGAMVGLNALLIHFASRRRNWARLLLLIFIVAGLALYFVWIPEVEAEPWWSWMGTIGINIFEIAAMAMLFSGASAKWYAPRGSV